MVRMRQFGVDQGEHASLQVGPIPPRGTSLRQSLLLQVIAYQALGGALAGPFENCARHRGPEESWRVACRIKRDGVSGPPR
jgi:hypothetical protein